METISSTVDLIGFLPFRFRLHFTAVSFGLNNTLISVRGQHVKRYCTFSLRKDYAYATVRDSNRNDFYKANFEKCPSWS